MTRKHKTPFRIEGRNGEWFAYCKHSRRLIPAPHVRDIITWVRGHFISVDAMVGRTPFEALERLKRHLGNAS